MIFVDTSAWFAVYVPSDPHHRAMCEATEAAPRLVTTDYVIDETLTLLRVRGHSQRAIQLGALLWEGKIARLEYLQPVDLQQAWTIFLQFRDKAWSFTDCTSLAVMRRLGVMSAISLDAHFQQMPGIAVSPPGDR